MRGGMLTGLAVTLGIVVALYLGMAALFGYAFASGFFFVVVSLVMILAILIQKPKGGGLAAAFGGGGGGGDQSMFGARVGDVMTWITVVLFVAFISLGIILVYTASSHVNAATPATGTEDVEQPAQTPAAPTDDQDSTPAPGGTE